MLHFRSPAVDRDLDPGLGLETTENGSSLLTTFSLTGLAPSAVVDTAQGSKLAKDLEAGMQVLTRDNGHATIRWVGESMSIYRNDDVNAPDHMRGPVRVKAGAWGTDPEAGNLVLNAGHRLLVRNPKNDLYFGTDEVIASVGDLTHLSGIDYVLRSVMRFKHVLLDTHELIRANGIWMESFSPEMWAIRVGFPSEWEEITECVPRLRYESGEANYIAPRMSLNTGEARLIDAV
ncbi:Hint domain-containing protein [Maritimibacter dapengensis]|uniref:Hint domain-containing protein n=1 Tax=Maritimibacter dapengensis TaxID=2836868 RepID=A0ABS6T266_9RHOB|nr:Hint domain-containing protein [Maritimibacter dapengensis]MBV7379348.1 Hint domain-containing protein [Maritimibacter dapengensis]